MISFWRSIYNFNLITKIPTKIPKLVQVTTTFIMKSFIGNWETIVIVMCCRAKAKIRVPDLVQTTFRINQCCYLLTSQEIDGDTLIYFVSVKGERRLHCNLHVSLPHRKTLWNHQSCVHKASVMRGAYFIVSLKNCIKMANTAYIFNFQAFSLIRFINWWRVRIVSLKYYLSSWLKLRMAFH